MADSFVEVTEGTGKGVDTRTESTNGHHRQVIVIGDPTTNSGIAPVDGTAGLKVNLGADNDVTVTGTVDLGATDNAVLDAIAASTDSAKTALEIIDNAISGSEMQVDVVGSLPAGGNAIGKLAANSGVDIGDVDVTSIIPGTGATNLGKAEDAAHVTGDTGVMLLGVRRDSSSSLTDADGDYIPFTTDSNGKIWTRSAAAQDGTWTVGLGAGTNNIGDVDVLSSALPTGAATSANQTTIIGHVDGLEGLLTTIDADTGNISTKIDTVAGAVSGSEMQVDVLTMPTVTINSIPAGNNNIGDVDVASIAAGDNNIGNVDIVTMPNVVIGSGTVTTVTTLTGGGIAHDSADSGNPHKVGFKAYSPDGTTPGTAVAEGDRTDAKADLDGRLYVNPRSPLQKHKHLDGTSAYTDEAIAADPGDGFQVVITSIIVSTGAATAMNFFLEEGSTKIFGPIYLEATAGRGFVSGPIYLPVTASTAVTITTSAAIAQSVDIDYFVQAV